VPNNSAEFLQILLDILPILLTLDKMTDEFRNIMRGYASTEDTTAVKTALRQYIGMLEDLYYSIQ